MDASYKYGGTDCGRGRSRDFDGSADGATDRRPAADAPLGQQFRSRPGGKLRAAAHHHADARGPAETGTASCDAARPFEPPTASTAPEAGRHGRGLHHPVGGPLAAARANGARSAPPAGADRRPTGLRGGWGRHTATPTSGSFLRLRPGGLACSTAWDLAPNPLRFVDLPRPQPRRPSRLSGTHLCLRASVPDRAPSDTRETNFSRRVRAAGQRPGLRLPPACPRDRLAHDGQDPPPGAVALFSRDGEINDGSGSDAELRLHWQATAQTALSSRVSLRQPSTGEDPNDLSEVLRYRLAAAWHPGEKWQLRSAAAYERRHFRGGNALPEREDDITEWTPLKISYKPMNLFTVSLATKVFNRYSQNPLQNFMARRAAVSVKARF